MLRRRYRRVDYVSAGGVAAGCALFVACSAALDARTPAPGASDTSGGALTLHADTPLLRQAAGAAILCLYLLFDGFTSTYQEHLFKSHAGVTATHLVMHVAAAATALAAVAALASGQLRAALAFIAAHPAAGAHVAALSLAAAGASLLINDTIRRFGALAFAGIMTSRQLLSVLASAAMFRQPLSAGQLGGGALVFGCLYARLLAGGGGGGVGKSFSSGRLSVCGDAAAAGAGALEAAPAGGEAGAERDCAV